MGHSGKVLDGVPKADTLNLTGKVNGWIAA